MTPQWLQITLHMAMRQARGQVMWTTLVRNLVTPQWLHTVIGFRKQVVLKSSLVMLFTLVMTKQG